jgi:tetratricopeptide (TPR) repeat protein
MPFPNEKPQTCSFCKKRPATAKYTYATTTEMIEEMVCATCLDRLEVQEAFEYKFRDIIIPLERNEQYDEALACLDAFLEANRHRDHDQWLARSIASHRAMILLDAGRYAAAEQACAAWAALGFDDVGERWMHGSVTAETLDELGRTREGLAVLEDALSYRDPKDVPGAWGHLKRLAEISEKLGQPVDPKWRSLAQASGEWYGVELPQHESLGKAIVELAEAIRKEGRMRRGEGEPSDDDDEP